MNEKLYKIKINNGRSFDSYISDVFLVVSEDEQTAVEYLEQNILPSTEYWKNGQEYIVENIEAIEEVNGFKIIVEPLKS